MVYTPGQWALFPGRLAWPQMLEKLTCTLVPTPTAWVRGHRVSGQASPCLVFWYQVSLGSPGSRSA